LKNFVSYFLFLSLGCFAQNKTEDNFYEENTSVNLFAFVGKKISIIEFDPNPRSRANPFAWYFNLKY
jgi:hypothetical protein